MLRNRSFVPAVLLSLSAVACTASAPKVDTAADEGAINAVREREISSFSAGQLDSTMAVFTTDAVVMPPNEPAVSGSDALRTWGQNMMNQFSISGRYTDAQVRVSGDLAVERYIGELTLTPKAGGAAMTERIKGIHVYQRQPDGTWRIAWDAWNSDAPPPAPAAAPKLHA
jgi:ketosteroid isomerase-like protein